MKKLIFTLCLAVTAVSCSFLKEDPESFVNRHSYFKTVSQCESVVNSTYSTLRTVFTTAMWTITEGTTDIIYEPSSSDINAILSIGPANSVISKTVWDNAYKMIMYANSAVTGIAASSIDETDKAALIAEAEIMRAFWYYWLTSLFGDVPFYLDDIVTEDQMNEIAHLPRMSAVQTRATLIERLNNCLSYADDGSYTGALPAVKASEIIKGRAGWALGEMLVAKMALWNLAKDHGSNTDWNAVALTALKRIESVYGELSQYPLADLYWRNKNTPEVIFEIQHTYTSTGLSYVGGVAALTTPKHNSGINYDGVDIEELGDQVKLGTHARPTLYFSGALQPNAGVDLRAKLNLAWDYNGQAFESVDTRPWLGPKFWCPHMMQNYDSNNYPLFRYADVVLMLAECYQNLKDQTHFLKYLNQVRTRAGLENYVFVKWSKAEEALKEERARELFGEFQRKLDLVRWGIWYERVSEYTDWEALRITMKPCHEYLPISDKQVIYSGGALDNNAYNKYGL